MNNLFKQPYRDEFLEKAGLYLLYAFILSLAANPFIMYFVGLDKFNYVTVKDKFEGLRDLSPQQQAILNRYQVVDQSFVDKQNAFDNYITWITLTALLGWCVTSPRFQRGWPKIVSKIKNNEPIYK